MLYNLTSCRLASCPLSIDYTGGTQWEMRFNATGGPDRRRQLSSSTPAYSDTKAFLVDDDRTVQVKFKNIDISQKEISRPGD